VSSPRAERSGDFLIPFIEGGGMVLSPFRRLNFLHVLRVQNTYVAVVHSNLSFFENI
jgi:hypothetical protein